MLITRKFIQWVHAIPSWVCLFWVMSGSGCATVPVIQMQVHRYRIEVALHPESHRLSGHAALDLVRTSSPASRPDQPVAIEFDLHPSLHVTQVYASPAEVLGRTSVRISNNNADATTRRHKIRIDKSVDSLTLFVNYEGKIFQDVSAGEKSGQIHNTKMRAHIGSDGIFLSGGNWYPNPVFADRDEVVLADFVLLAQHVDGFELASSGYLDTQLSNQTGGYAWRNPYPIENIVLVGGRHEIHTTRHNGITLRAHLKPEQSRFAQGLLNTAKRIIDRYEPLIGPYPASEFSIVDNFFSSGFAFPTFTLLSSAVINMGERSQITHGYIDHEILHSWWGNGIYVDPKDGNWCEALTSYAANYYGHILDGNENEARRKRRNYSHFLSRMKPKLDRPLGTYGQPDGCSRGIAYSKGAAVFHMLAKKIGQENFWSAMKTFTHDYVGRHAGWDDIQKICEQQSGVSLETFFRQWVRSSGAPTLSIESARYHTADQQLTLSISQHEPAFELDVPIRVKHVGGQLDTSVTIRSPNEDVSIPLDITPLSVEIDPEYHVFRKIPIKEILPTTASTRYGQAFISVLPAGVVAESYKKVKSIFESSFEDDERISLTVEQLQEGTLAQRCVLILGDAVRNTYITGFLSAVQFPVKWIHGGFKISGVQYTNPKDAVLCTVRHPGVEGGGITVVYANSQSAIPKAMNIPMYEHSLIVFEDGKPTVRQDFEHRKVVHVEH